MLNEIICAGFGGQGVLTAGKIIVYAAYKKGLKVTWFPSYGNEMRGGSANCNVVISDQRIASPYANHPDTLIELNCPATDRFEPMMKPGGYLFINSSLLDSTREFRGDITLIKAPVTEIAQNLKNEHAANICMLGQWVKVLGMFSKEEFVRSMSEYFDQLGKGKYNAKNAEAFEAGYVFQ